MIMSSLLNPAGAVPLVADRPSLWRRAAAMVTAAFAGLRDRHQRRMAIAELERLDDRLLRDIGISRTDIHRIVMSDGVRHPG
jgi:uncharacterized protein YjiS (DUF1127 family)